jgi:hypothetical protein
MHAERQVVVTAKRRRDRATNPCSTILRVHHQLQVLIHTSTATAALTET